MKRFPPKNKANRRFIEKKKQTPSEKGFKPRT